MEDAKTKVERHANLARNRIISRASHDLDKIVHGHDPDIHHLGNRVWDRLDDMAVEIEALAAPQPAASDVPHDVVRAPDAWIEREGLEALRRDKTSKTQVASGLLKRPFGDKVPLYNTPVPSNWTEEALRAENALPHDLFTHREAWRSALILMRNGSPPPAHDHDDRGYWQHELDVFDRVFTALSALSR